MSETVGVWTLEIDDCTLEIQAKLIEGEPLTFASWSGTAVRTSQEPDSASYEFRITAAEMDRVNRVREAVSDLLEGRVEYRWLGMSVTMEGWSVLGTTAWMRSDRDELKELQELFTLLIRKVDARRVA